MTGTIPRLLCTAFLLWASAASATALDIPTSARSLTAIQRVAPGLEAYLAAMGLRLGVPIFIRILKNSRELQLWVEGGQAAFNLFRTYPICNYSGLLGPKLPEGDMQSPEGFYFVTPNQMNPSSAFHLSFNLGFPNACDRAHGRTGSDLMVHGRCASTGCYAMTDPGIEKIYALVDAAFRGGQRFFRAHVFPFPMTAANMAEHRESRWDDFWRTLEEGYTFSRGTGVRPRCGCGTEPMCSSRIDNGSGAVCSVPAGLSRTIMRNRLAAKTRRHQGIALQPHRTRIPLCVSAVPIPIPGGRVGLFLKDINILTPIL
jgi:murein L,D-transpeptidase YafK